jgi:hypothetical protein
MMRIEKLEDLLEINTDTLKSPEKSRLLTKIKQLIKLEKKTEAGADESAADLPYEAISIVGNKYVTVRFDLKDKKGRVTEVNTDTRDVRGKNYMSGAKAIKRMQELIKEQKEISDEV